MLVLTFATTDRRHARPCTLVEDISSKPANVEGTVIELTVDHGPAAAADALRRIDGGGIDLAGLQLREPSLDDVFLNFTGHKAEDEPIDDSNVADGRSKRKASA